MSGQKKKVGRFYCGKRKRKFISRSVVMNYARNYEPNLED